MKFVSTHKAGQSKRKKQTVMAQNGLYYRKIEFKMLLIPSVVFFLGLFLSWSQVGWSQNVSGNLSIAPSLESMPNSFLKQPLSTKVSIPPALNKFPQTLNSPSPGETFSPGPPPKDEDRIPLYSSTIQGPKKGYLFENENSTKLYLAYHLNTDNRQFAELTINEKYSEESLYKPFSSPPPFKDLPFVIKFYGGF